MTIVYLDNNATSMVAPETVDMITPFFHTYYGNPSSMHTFGGQIGEHINTARKQVASLINSQHTDEIVFTSCGTESDNTAILSALATTPNKRHIITSAVEHPGVLNLIKKYESEYNYTVTYLPVNESGQLNLHEFEKAITPETALVSIMWANNETGVIFPIKRIAEICQQHNIPFHVDAVQAAGKEVIDLQKIPITFLSLSGHKIHAPKGIGALYVRRGTPFHPMIIGGHQEHGKRSGTHNVPSIIAFGHACEQALTHMPNNSKIAALRDILEKELLSAIPDVFIHGDTGSRLCNTSNLGFDAVEGEAILLMLNEFGICASSGSACSSGSLDPSHVMKAMDIPFRRAHGSIRFSLSRYSTKEDIDAVIQHLPPIIERLRELSPII